MLEVIDSFRNELGGWFVRRIHSVLDSFGFVTVDEVER